MKTISIISGKGGSGKSIISASLAHILSFLGQKVLLVDLDIFTRGLSFYLLSYKPYKAKFGISDYLKEENDKRQSKYAGLLKRFSPLIINDDFTKNNLHFIPASANLESYFHEENFLFNENNFVVDKLHYLFESFNRTNEYDVIIIDTPGGNNSFSNLIANLSNGYIIVTEADKTSWDTVDLLISGIKETNISINNFDYRISDRNSFGNRLGFILNKNTLEPREIVSFLKQRFQCDELVTIPLDIEAVRCFQNDEIPVVKDINIEFSKKIVELTKNLFLNSENWNPKSDKILESLNKKLSEAELKKKRIEDRLKLTMSFTKILPLIISLLAFILAINLFIETYKISNNTLALLLFAIGYLSSMSSFVFIFKRKK